MHTYRFTHICTCTYTHIRTHTYTHRRGPVAPNLRNVYLHMHIHTYKYMYTQFLITYTHTYIHTYIQRIHTHTYTHIHTHRRDTGAPDPRNFRRRSARLQSRAHQDLFVGVFRSQRPLFGGRYVPDDCQGGRWFSLRGDLSVYVCVCVCVCA